MQWGIDSSEKYLKSQATVLILSNKNVRVCVVYYHLFLIPKIKVPKGLLTVTFIGNTIKIKKRHREVDGLKEENV